MHSWTGLLEQSQCFGKLDHLLYGGLIRGVLKILRGNKLYSKRLSTVFFIVLPLIALLLTGLFLLNRNSGVRMLCPVDRYFLNETLKEAVALSKNDEDWSALCAVKGRNYDYRWLLQSSGLIKIAHRLGEYDNPNTLAAFQNSRAKGFSFFEVDLWLDENDVIRCHHGPEKPTPLKEGSCTFDRLVNFLGDSEYVLLDIKTDFFKTSAAILIHLENNPYSKQVIFQLNLPGHVEQFSRWVENYQLAGPIVAAYRSSRSLNHVYNGIDKTGIKVFAFSIDRIPAFTGDRNGEIERFIYPVRDCTEMRMAKKMARLGQLKGIYVQNSLICEEES